MTDATNERTSPWGNAALAVWAVLGDRPVAYHPALARALGNDINAALFLGQIMYWADKGTWKPGWVAKTQQEIYNETALTRSQQERVRRKLTKLGVISEKLMDVPARLYFRVHFAKLTKLLMAHLQEEMASSDCRKPADKDAENPQTIPQEPANQSAENQQSIPESSTETTPESTHQKSDGKPSRTPVLDQVFPDSSKIRSDGVVIGGNLDDLSEQERAQVATPGSGQAKHHMDLVQAAWYNSNKRVTFPFGLNWVDVFEYARLFSELFDIAIPSVHMTISQWRRGIVETMIAFADDMRQSGLKADRERVIRHARWGLQVLHARRLAGQDWTFTIVSPVSTTKTLRVIAGDLRKMMADNPVSQVMGMLPEREQIIDYYDSMPGKTRKVSGSDQTEQAILKLQAAAEMATVSA